jgi:hypothetical protein
MFKPGGYGAVAPDQASAVVIIFDKGRSTLPAPSVAFAPFDGDTDSHRVSQTSGRWSTPRRVDPFQTTSAPGANV